MLEVKINSRGTGACPQCRFTSCHITTKIKEALKDVVAGKIDNEMEIVIYKCPRFVEKEGA
jgi:hypothetical protein